MHGPIQRMIQSQGTEYTVRNATGGGGGRETPDYSDDETPIVGVLERRSRPMTETLSSGEDVQVDLEIRAVPNDDVDLVGAGEETPPTKLDHPNGQTFQVVAPVPEDSGVTVLTVVRE